MGKPKWTEKHVAHAKSALLRLTATALETGDLNLASTIARAAAREDTTSTIGAFVAALALHLDPGSNAERILRVVCARAEEMEVVDRPDTFYRLRRACGRYVSNTDNWAPCERARDAVRIDDRAHAIACAETIPGMAVVRVTLTRRRYLPSR